MYLAFPEEGNGPVLQPSKCCPYGKDTFALSYSLRDVQITNKLIFFFLYSFFRPQNEIEHWSHSSWDMSASSLVIHRQLKCSSRNWSCKVATSYLWEAVRSFPGPNVALHPLTCLYMQMYSTSSYCRYFYINSWALQIVPWFSLFPALV